MYFKRHFNNALSSFWLSLKQLFVAFTNLVIEGDRTYSIFYYRIMELLSLETTLKVIESNLNLSILP